MGEKLWENMWVLFRHRDHIRMMEKWPWGSRIFVGFLESEMECFWREKWRENDGGKDDFSFW